MKRLPLAVALAVAVFAVACSNDTTAPTPAASNTMTPAFSRNGTPGVKTAVTTTLDACGYFVGTSTANKTSQKGTLFTDNGTWTGVSNNYGGGLVESLGIVSGSYSESYNYDSGTGVLSNGSETFKSNSGTITQTFGQDATGWHVTVVATGDLSFLTSDTNGACYSGTFPRP